jgi:hypothetical protein
MSIRMLHKTVAMSSHALAIEFLSHLVKQLPKLRSDHLARYFAVCGAPLPESVQTSPALAGLSSMSSDRSRPPDMSQLNPNLSQLHSSLTQLNPNLSQLNPKCFPLDLANCSNCPQPARWTPSTPAVPKLQSPRPLHRGLL